MRGYPIRPHQFPFFEVENSEELLVAENYCEHPLTGGSLPLDRKKRIPELQKGLGVAQKLVVSDTD